MTLKIDRSAFLLLSSAIASGGCTVVHNTQAPAPADTGVASDTGNVDIGTSDVADSADVDTSEVPTCDDSVGTPGDCTMMAPADEGTCGGTTWAATQCNDYKDAFKPKVAQATIACMLKLTSIEVCDAGRTYKCAHDALMAACSDSTASSACDAIITGCAGGVAPTKSECMQTLAGMNSTGRDRMVTCMKTACVASGLYGCEEGI